jgi:hypothetical protein
MLKPSEVAINKAINTTFRACFGRPAPNSFETRMLKINKMYDQVVGQTNCRITFFLTYLAEVLKPTEIMVTIDEVLRL